MDKINNLKQFFSQPGINISGVCDEAKIHQRQLRRYLNEEFKLTDKFYQKLLPVIKKYGFKE